MDAIFKISGKVAKGRSLGTEFGFPTANLNVSYNGLESAADVHARFGVYVARVEFAQESYYGVMSFGTNPTVNQCENESRGVKSRGEDEGGAVSEGERMGDGMGEVRAECHIFDFHSDIYGKEVTFYALKKIRDMIKFSSLDELKRQIAEDTIIAKNLVKTINKQSEIMGKSLKGTRTEKNLLASFAGESQARNRYQMFAKQAKKEGYEVIAKFFEETAENERQHAKQFFSFLEGGMVEITATYPAGLVGTTIENLREAAQGEHEEGFDLYPVAAEIAKEEGFDDVARKFRQIAEIEKHHEARYRGLCEVLEAEEFFHKAESKTWRCRECGHEHEGKDALAMCPVCNHPQSYQEIKSDVY